MPGALAIILSNKSYALTTTLFKIDLASAFFRHREYVNKTLPKELELDKPFAEVFAMRNKKLFPANFDEESQGLGILDAGNDADFLLSNTKAHWPEVNYAWPELGRIKLKSTLYDCNILRERRRGFVAQGASDLSIPRRYENARFQRLRARIQEIARLYLKRSGWEKDELPQRFLGHGLGLTGLLVPADAARFKIFIWVEALRPSAHTDGGYAMGRYWVQAKQLVRMKNAMKFNFEDVLVAQGYAFSVYPERGNNLDFEDDETGKFIWTEDL
ncbi:hypothetical protein AK812_SmicGene258 [Symbiodinium microadriaticum]|uniref:Uncharacterized protein n=1 Tax=Symbiodinium microadriaticum TaxID=2951 RepID=A0A1Q9F771_SYMMI|nr:hypothetical protein AK812_SmicGene258 [Symbiodinium microadriaticum]